MMKHQDCIEEMKKSLPPRDIGPMQDCPKELEENITKETRKKKHLIGSNLIILLQKN